MNATRVAAHAVAAAVLAATLVEGELLRVDVGKRMLFVRPASGPPRELDVTVDAATVITASGRARAIEELKTGERIVVACEAAGPGSCRAKRIRAGPGRHAVPPAAAR